MKHLLTLTSLCLLIGCNTPMPCKETADTLPQRAAYYWRTIFRLNTAERRFLTDHKVEKLYVRLFDVLVQEGQIVPNATIKFLDSLPQNIEIVPTVFLVKEVFEMNVDFVDKLYERITTMCETHDIKIVKEWQIDCDWTRTTAKQYFDFLRKLKTKLPPPLKLSATIRLHQFTMTPPPVDKGVLMCYNTGGIKDRKTKNSILNIDDIRPYVKDINQYKLPIDIAYPTFNWAVCFDFRDGSFKALFRNLATPPDNEHLEWLDKNQYKTISPFIQEGVQIEVGDEIRIEESHYDEIIKAKKLIEPNINNRFSTIIYHLDKENLSAYTKNEIDTIYNH